MPRSSVLLALLLLASCASASPTLYTLDSRPGVIRTGGPRLVVVRSFGVPRYLERQEVVYSAGPDLLVASDNDWWAEPLGVMLRRVMVDDVPRRLPNSDVLTGGGSIASRPDAEVQIDLLRWYRPVGQFGGRVKLDPGCCQAASLSVIPAPYASSGVRPANVE